MDNVRWLELHLASPRPARGVRLELTGAAVLEARINGVAQTSPAWSTRDRWFLRYYGMTADATDVGLELPASARNFILHLTDQADGLPALDGFSYVARSPDMAPVQIAQDYMPFPETTSVSRTYQVE